MPDTFGDIVFQETRLREGLRKLGDQRKIVENAFNFAKEAHRDQIRDEQTPYVIHPVRIANTLIFDLGITDAELIAAGILHDVVEDTAVSTAIIAELFGERIGRLVKALTRNKDLHTKEEKFRETMKEDADVRLLKACDWLDNLRSFPYRTDRGERWQRHLSEAKALYIPMAQSVNRKIADEMEQILTQITQVKN